MRRGTPPIGSVERALRVLHVVVNDGAERNLTALAREAGVPVASLHRIVRALARSGHLTSVSRGRYAAGPALRTLAEEALSTRAIAAAVRPALDALARRTRRIAHFGVLEDDMVTYLVKAGRGAERLFTREGLQLEAYCSGIGKLLLAHLEDEDRERYLASGPFVALTPNTRTDPDDLRAELARIRADGFAVDNREVAPDLSCLAAPVFAPDGRARAAISLSAIDDDTLPVDGPRRAALQAAARQIERLLFGVGSPAPG